MKRELKSILGRLTKNGYTLKKGLLIVLCVAAVAGTTFAINSN